VGAVAFFVRRQIMIAGWLWLIPQAEGNPWQRHFSHPEPMRRLPKTQNPQLQMPKMQHKHTKPRIRQHMPHFFISSRLSKLYI
jgi:hypothetical protein